MAKILISNSFPNQPILRQIPVRAASWCGHEFELSEADGPVDVWIVYDNLLEPKTVCCPRHRTMLITAEPPSIRRYRSAFTSQFGAVRTCHETIQHRRIERSHEAQPWHYGLYPCRTHPQVLDYDTLASFKPPAKSKLLSVISSNKIVTEDHRQRLKFVGELKAAFGDQVDVFGRGICDVADKADAIWDYKYHIALENDHSQYYMSEKLLDGFLGWSFPFYSGGKYADSVLPRKSFARIDMYDPTQSIATIKKHIESGAYESNLLEIGKARSMVLDELNLFAVLCRSIDAMIQFDSQHFTQSSDRMKRTTLLPKRKSMRLSVQQWMRAISLAA